MLFGIDLAALAPEPAGTAAACLARPPPTLVVCTPFTTGPTVLEGTPAVVEGITGVPEISVYGSEAGG